MYCPKCGAPGQTAKAYCKTCGKWLPNLDGKARHTFGGETPQQIISTNLFMSAITTLAALFSGLARLIRISKTAFNENFMNGVLNLIAFIALLIVGLRVRDRMSTTASYIA